MSQAYEQLQVLGGELVTYTPYQKSPRQVLALIDPVRRTDQMGQRQFLTKTYIVMIVKSASEGIAFVKESFDTLSLKIQKQDAAETVLRVTKILPDRDDGTPGDGVGMWYLEAVI